MGYCTQNKVEAFADAATLLENFWYQFDFILSWKQRDIFVLVLFPKWKVLS